MPLFFSQPAESRCKACEWTWTSEAGQSKYCPKCGSSKVDNMSNALRASGGVTLCLLIAGAGTVGIALYNGWNPTTTAEWLGHRLSAATANKDTTAPVGNPTQPPTSDQANPSRRKLSTELEPPRHATRNTDGSSPATNPATPKTTAPAKTAPAKTAPAKTSKTRPTTRDPDPEPTPPRVNPELEVQLVAKLSAPSAEKRYRAAAQLGQLDRLSEPTLAALRRAVQDDDQMVRVAAGYALRKASNPTSATHLPKSAEK